MSTPINPITSSIAGLLGNQAAGSDSALSGASAGFADVLNDAFETARQTEQLDKVSSLELLAGQADSLSGLMLDAQKAELSLNLALQLRTKVLDAYKEIMGIQV